MASFIKGYGPIHAFWLFSFERYNGLLGKQRNNNKAIEIQLMRCFFEGWNALKSNSRGTNKTFMKHFMMLDMHILLTL